MSHFVYQRPSGDWSGVVMPLNIWFTGFDQQLFKAVNGDDGGTWAPTSAIIIGGQGLQVPGPFTAADVLALTLPNTALVDAQSGSEIRLDAGALFLTLASSQMQIGGILEITSGGTLDLDGSVDPTYTTPRTITKRRLQLVSWTDAGTNNSGPAVGTSPDGWPGFNGLTHADVIYTRNYTGATGNPFLNLAVPAVEMMTGATLVSVSVVSQGFSSPNPTTWPQYDVIRFAPASPGSTVQSLRSGGAVPDAHQAAGTWLGDQRVTTFTTDQNNVIDPSAYQYRVNATLPALATSGAQMMLFDVVAIYSVPSLRR